MNIELMAPAGGINNFFACISAGCNSVYLGFKKFNARRPAENFTIHDLKKALSYAHSSGKKVYITLNIDLKSNELKEAAELLLTIEELGADAVIIKDFALISIINKFFKKTSIHLSTQNAVTSSLGLEFAKKIGAERVVMARELTLDELKIAGSVEGIEVEVFTEGSMCFSVSGRCLMSSWVGARSGNRGACTAPCRVIWRKDNKSERYFAMKDLTVIIHLEELSRANIKALKIEGRLKNAGWVHTITSIYRQALNNPDDKKTVETLFEELKKYSAREKKDGHLFGHKDLIGKNEEWDNYLKTDNANFIPDDFFDKNKIDISTTDDSLSINILLFGKTTIIKTALPEKPKKAKPVNLRALVENLSSEMLIKKLKFQVEGNGIENISLGSSFIRDTAEEIIRRINALLRDEEKTPGLAPEIVDFIQMKKKHEDRKMLLGDYPDKIILAAWQDISKFMNIENPISTIVVYIEPNINTVLLKQLAEKYQLILALPDVMFEERAVEIKQLVCRLHAEGFNNFEANSYEGLEILSGIDCISKAGTGLAVMNHLAADYLYSLGIREVCASIEGDSSVFKSVSGFSECDVSCLVYGKVHLFTTRVYSPAFVENSVFEDKYTAIECHIDDEIFNFIASKPVSFIGPDYKKENISFDHLTADLRFFSNPGKALNDIFNITKTDKSASFNFFRKLV